MKSFDEQATKAFADDIPILTNMEYALASRYFVNGYEKGIDFILQDIIEALKIAGDIVDQIHDENYRIIKWIEKQYELNK